MAREHAFNIGLPDNIVNCYEFLAVLQGKLDKYVEFCLFSISLGGISFNLEIVGKNKFHIFG